MIERSTPLFGRLVFDRDAIVRAALRAYVEALFGNFPFNHVAFPASGGAMWAGDPRRGALYDDDGCGSYVVVAWTEAGIVGLAYDLGAGPIQQLDLSVDAVTGGPDDVRGALPGLPDALEPALVMATGRLAEGLDHKEKLAGVGFWLYGDHVAGTMFDDPRPFGASRLAAWGLLHKGRLLPLLSSAECSPRPGGIVVDYALPEDVPIHAILDAVTDRALKGPTEFTTEELATLLPTPLTPERLVFAQRTLQIVGITWPGSPEIPPGGLDWPP